MSKNMQVILGLLVVLLLILFYVQSRVASTFGNFGNNEVQRPSIPAAPGGVKPGK